MFRNYLYSYFLIQTDTLPKVAIYAIETKRKTFAMNVRKIAIGNSFEMKALVAIHLTAVRFKITTKTAKKKCFDCGKKQIW